MLWNRSAVLLVVFAAMGISEQARADIVYTLIDHPSLQTGAFGSWTLSGTITADVDTNTISAWNFTLTDGVKTVVANSNQAGNSATFFGSGVHLIEESGILYVRQSGGYLAIGGSGSEAGATIRWDTDGGGYLATDGGFYLANTGTPNTFWSSAGQPLDSQTSMAIAVVPEPSSFVLSMAVVGAISTFRLRRRRFGASD